MGFLLRCCFWIGLALLFIPFGTGGADGEGPSVNPIQTLVAARDAVMDIASLCERQPAVCETASAALQTVIARAGEGMRLAQQLIDSNQPEESEEVSTHPRPEAKLDEPETPPARSELMPFFRDLLRLTDYMQAHEHEH